MNIQKFQPKHEVNPRRPSDASCASAFTLTELAVVMGCLGILAVLVIPALGNAKVDSRQLSCLNNLRQLGIASHMYVVDYRQYTQCYKTANHTYVWPNRLLGYTGGQRSLYSCPAASPSARWDTNFNRTLIAAVAENGKIDRYGIYSGDTDNNGTFFSYGFNDWGLSISPPLGLGGDVGSAIIRDSDVVAPSQMIMLGDTPALTNMGAISFTANLDPKVSSSQNPNASSQVPSNRHLYLTDIVFTDGHTETPKRKDVIDPANTFWRSRWDNDNQPHNEFTWTVPSNYNRLDPSY
jgi:type II secretory pathway pseudopilin PulG